MIPLQVLAAIYSLCHKGAGNSAGEALCAREPAGCGAVGLSLQLLYCCLGCGAWAVKQERAHVTFRSVVTRTHCAVRGGGSRA